MGGNDSHVIDNIRAIFHASNVAKDGMLNLEQLTRVFLSLDRRMTARGIKTLFAQVDKNKRGLVELDEFLCYIFRLDEAADIASTHEDCAQGLSPTSFATTSRLFAQPSQTLIFFDWDDTVFPTTEVFDRWGLPKRKAFWSKLSLSASQQQQLEQWQDAAYQYLSTARGLSDRCVIVTNAERPWVQDTISHFAPRLVPLFDWGPSGSDDIGGGGDGAASSSPLLRVVYAREAMTRHDERFRPVLGCDALTEDEHRERLTAWKFAAMRREVRKFYSQYPKQTWKNVLSIGDGRYEHDALQEVTFRRKSPSRERLRTKVIVLWPEPSILEITIRLRKSQLLLPAYVSFDGDIDVDLSGPRESVQHPLSDALGMPELKEVTRVRTESAAETLDVDLDEIAVAVQSAFERK